MRPSFLTAIALGLAGLGATLGTARPPALLPARSDSTPPSSSWLALLPDGTAKRRFILDCTGCHQFDERMARPGGKPRTEADWAQSVARMLGFAGPNSGFPVISAGQHPDSTARWLATALSDRVPQSGGDSATPLAGTVTEFLLPGPQDLPHDVAVDATGRVIVTGMFTHTMYTLDSLTGEFASVPIPVDKSNPRAVEVDGQGRWWVVLGAPGQIARYDGVAWKTFETGLYAHSIALDSAGSAWVNGHFSRDPEVLVGVTSEGVVRIVDLPGHPTMRDIPGGPIPYELRAAPDGRIWMSELQGNRMVSFDPRTGEKAAYDLPAAWSGPRRFDIDRSGILWIPAYSAGSLVRFDPAKREFKEYPLPVKDALPYVARVDHGTGRVWIGTGAADQLFAFDSRSGRFRGVRLPSRGALVRHLAVDPRTHDVWLAYGESPGKLPARIARFRPTR